MRDTKTIFAEKVALIEKKNELELQIAIMQRDIERLRAEYIEAAIAEKQEAAANDE